MEARVTRKTGKGRDLTKRAFPVLLICLLLPAIALCGQATGEPAPNQIEMPGGGRKVEITGTTDVSFSPKASAMWILFTDDRGDSDPFLELYDPGGSLIKTDEESFGGGNAMLLLFLAEGETYRIRVGFKGDSGETCTFRIFSPFELPGSGGIEEIMDWGVLSFTPYRSGTWQFATLSGGPNINPYIRIYDALGNVIAEDDNGGDGNNSAVPVELAAGEPYGVFLSSHGSGKSDFWVAVLGK